MTNPRMLELSPENRAEDVFKDACDNARALLEDIEKESVAEPGAVAVKTLVVPQAGARDFEKKVITVAELEAGQGPEVAVTRLLPSNGMAAHFFFGIKVEAFNDKAAPKKPNYYYVHNRQRGGLVAYRLGVLAAKRLPEKGLLPNVDLRLAEDSRTGNVPGQALVGVLSADHQDHLGAVNAGLQQNIDLLRRVANGASLEQARRSITVA